MKSIVRVWAVCVFSMVVLLAPCFATVTSGASSPAVVPEPSAVNYDYRNYSEIKSELLRIESQHPGIAKVYDIGDSYEKAVRIADRDILAIKISDNVLVNEDEPEILIVGLHHAREWSTSELVLEIANNLTSSYGNDTRVSWLVDNREVWIVPVVNPDGLDYSLVYDQWWRKNRHPNYDGSYGVDLNRNYGGAMNGDPDGNWGGEGSSHIPSDEVYCGQTPFSEPETLSIRSLVMAHDFKLALDFHSYSELVLWPWGYTTNLTPDNTDLVRIGNEFADLNGYTPEQSVGLYPTTGDSLDWMYGAEDVYAFCFEVGLEFHPAKTTDVLGIINENLPPAILGIELAGDREERPFQIAHAPVASRNYSSSGYGLSADITAARGINTSALSMHYRVDGGPWSATAMTLASGNDTYSAIVPSQPIGSQVDYYFVARDNSSVELMSPRYAPYQVHSFEVISEDPGSPLEVEFTPPESVDGSRENTVVATARNVSTGSELVLHVRNYSKGVWENLTMAESTPSAYACDIPSLMPLGAYDLWLTVEEGGVVVWSSPVTALSVIDGTAPVFGSHSANQPDHDHVLVQVNCSDGYAVMSVTISYREQGSPALFIETMALVVGNESNGTWSITIPVLGPGIIEYNFTATDVNQSSTDPADGGVYEFSPVIVAEFPGAALVLVAAALAAVVVVSLKRRP